MTSTTERQFTAGREKDALIWWVRDAANSICGQTGAKTHQEKLHKAADEMLAMADVLEELLTALPNPDAKSGKFFDLRDRARTVLSRALGRME